MQKQDAFVPHRDVFLIGKPSARDAKFRPETHGAELKFRPGAFLAGIKLKQKKKRSGLRITDHAGISMGLVRC